jgi:hypothetical protein
VPFKSPKLKGNTTGVRSTMMQQEGRENSEMYYKLKIIQMPKQGKIAPCMRTAVS